MKGLVQGVLALVWTPGHLTVLSATMEARSSRPRGNPGTWNVIPMGCSGALSSASQDNLVSGELWGSLQAPWCLQLVSEQS